MPATDQIIATMLANGPSSAIAGSVTRTPRPRRKGPDAQSAPARSERVKAKSSPPEDAYPAHWTERGRVKAAPHPTEPDAYPAHWKH